MTTDILVTGATGFLGRWLVAALEKKGYRVLCHSSAQGDIARCRLPMENVGHVFHLAAKTFVPDSWRCPQTFYETNVLGTVNVLEHCRQNGAALTLLSSYVYGVPQHLPIREDHPLSALNPYGQTKILAETVAHFYEQHHGLRVVIIRPFNLYGPGQATSFLIPMLVTQMLDTSQAVVSVKDLRPKRDYLFIEDAVQMLLLSLRAEIRGTYNMGSGWSASVEEIAQLISQAAGVEKPVVSESSPRPNEVMNTLADISRAESELGWRPSTSFQDGIAAVVAAARGTRG
jgi:nucleoside-diphosphate-sugar epimerase